MSVAVETFIAALRAHGQRPALVEAERQLSYAQLLLETQARAEQLHQLGAQRLGRALDIEHGGSIELHDSPFGGLEVLVRLPRKV